MYFADVEIPAKRGSPGNYAPYSPEFPFWEIITGALWPRPHVLERLPQHIEHMTLKLGEFVQE
jgi:hypothetical protein